MQVNFACCFKEGGEQQYGGYAVLQALKDKNASQLKHWHLSM